MCSARFAFLGRLFRHQRRFFLWNAVRPSVLEFDFSPITEKHPCGCFFQREKGLIRSPSPLCVGSFTLRARQLRGQVPPSLFALALPVRKLRRSNPLFGFGPFPQQTEKHPCGCFFQREKGLIRSPSPLCVGSFTLRARQLRGQVPPSLFALALPVRKLRRSNPLFGFGPFPQQTEKHPFGCFFSAGKGTDSLAVSALRRLVHPSGPPASRSSPSVAFRTRVARA